MEGRKLWIIWLKNKLSNSPLVSNIAFGFTLILLEKLVEMEFKCPCDPKWNRLFSSTFFVIPAVMAFALMLIIQGCRNNNTGPERSRTTGRSQRNQNKLKPNTKSSDTWYWNTVSTVSSSFVPAVVWLTLLFLDGQYFACSMTYWEGRFVIMDKAAPQKWCEPTSDRDIHMLRFHNFFFISQGIGMILLIFICMGLLVYLARQSPEEKQKKIQNQRDSTQFASTRLRSRRATI